MHRSLLLLLIFILILQPDSSLTPILFFRSASRSHSPLALPALHPTRSRCLCHGCESRGRFTSYLALDASAAGMSARFRRRGSAFNILTSATVEIKRLAARYFRIGNRLAAWRQSHSEKRMRAARCAPLHARELLLKRVVSNASSTVQRRVVSDDCPLSVTR